MTANTLSDAQKAEGWQLLFDGQSTKGWHRYGGKPVGSAWKIADGTIYLDTAQKENWQIKDGGDIVSDDEFDNFHLKLEWKIAKDGNSGIIFFVHEDTAKYKWPWETGPEMQVLDNSGHPDSKIIKHRAGDLYDLISSSKETVKPAGEWNLAEIKSENGKLDFYLNGENIVSTTMWDDAWKKMIAGSKFIKMPDFGTYKKGHIALQDHGNTVWYRNIMIKKL
ncbi:MAG: DUF1080 domain-containing protein [Bacteroidetes bacterium]|nr:DUF1080 domain-containing protein [Bacteroidota bacterium]